MMALGSSTTISYFILSVLTVTLRASSLSVHSNKIREVAVTCRNLQLPRSSNAIQYSAGSDDARPVNSTALYECTLGFDVFGDSLRVCQSNGEWSGAEPLCELHDCGQPPSIQNGFPETPLNTTYRVKVAYSCEDNFVLQGSRFIECTAVSWQTPPECLASSMMVYNTTTPTEPYTSSASTDSMPGTTPTNVLCSQGIGCYIGMAVAIVIGIIIVTMMTILAAVLLRHKKRHRRDKRKTEARTQGLDSPPTENLTRYSVNQEQYYENIDSFLPLENSHYETIELSQCSAYTSADITELTQCPAYNCVSTAC